MTTHITPGSTSTDSCRLEDIVDGVRYLAGSDKKLSDLIIEFDVANSVTIGREYETISFIFDDICDQLNDMAPEHIEFGSHPGDGADYGFWEIETGEYEDNPGSFGYPHTVPEP